MQNAKKSVYPAAAIALLIAGQAQATIVVDNSGASPSCDTSLVTLADTAPPSGDYADACIGYLAKPGSKAAEKALLDTRTGGDWSFVYKIAEGETEGSGLFQGISIELTNVDLGSTAGFWNITWKDVNGDAAPNLPLTVDLAASFKAGTSIAYFLFEGVELLAPAVQGDPLTLQGTFRLQVINGLSHESLFVRVAQQPEEPPFPPTQVSTPSALLLLSGPLLGLAIRRRRRY